MQSTVAVAMNATRLIVVIFCAISSIAYSHRKQRTSFTASHPLVVASILVEPYLMLNSEFSNSSSSSSVDHPHHNNNDRYVGYMAELIYKLSQMIGFSYVIKPVEDGSYGYLRPDGTWDGIIGEIVNGKASIAAAPVYVTKQRSKVVDFTDVFLTVYATVLVRGRHHLTSGHHQHHHHQDHHRQGQQQTMIRSIKELANQSEVRYGTLNKGVLVRAFKRTNVSLYKTLWRQMQRFEPSVFTSSNEEGIERIRQRHDYAFILPHTIAEYVALRDPCDLVTVGRFLVHRGYALAVRKESPLLRRQLNNALRRLTATGYVDGLYRKWWFGRSDCGDDGAAAGAGGGAMVPRSQKVYSVRNRAAIDPAVPPSMTARGTSTLLRRPRDAIRVILICRTLLLFIVEPLVNGGGHWM